MQKASNIMQDKKVRYRSEVITDAYFTEEEVTRLNVKLQLGQRPTALVLKVTRMDNKDWFYCCLVGGTVLPNGETRLTLSGEVTLAAATRLIPPSTEIAVYEIDCTVNNAQLRSQIVDAISDAPSQGLLIFLGDMAGRCDGRMLLNMNVIRRSAQPPL